MDVPNVANMVTRCQELARAVRITANRADPNDADNLISALKSLQGTIGKLHMPISVKANIEKIVAGCVSDALWIQTSFNPLEIKSLLGQIPGWLESVRELLPKSP